MLTAALGLALALSACGDSKESANSVDVQMKDLETVDGTINDAMTDLDGVQTEGTAMAETGNNSTAAATPTETTSAAAKAEAEGTTADAEVVAEQ
ncbi:MAG: hypothetical protein KDE67_12685 [Sphingobium sp.]|nr:hypothetical protein [Sphingobium sp.]MCP5400679.1 hypothetical protein [Sphingomonas sp.]